MRGKVKLPEKTSHPNDFQVGKLLNDRPPPPTSVESSCYCGSARASRISISGKYDIISDTDHVRCRHDIMLSSSVQLAEVERNVSSSFPRSRQKERKNVKLRVSRAGPCFSTDTNTYVKDRFTWFAVNTLHENSG